MPDSWTKEDDKLVKQFEFDNFARAIEFINSVGEKAEAMNHHPDILLHKYNKVQLTLTTHSENKITKKDYTLANQIDEIS